MQIYGTIFSPSWNKCSLILLFEMKNSIQILFQVFRAHPLPSPIIFFDVCFGDYNNAFDSATLLELLTLL